MTNCEGDNLDYVNLDRILREEELQGRPKFIQLSELTEKDEFENCILLPSSCLYKPARKKCIDSIDAVPFTSCVLKVKQIPSDRIFQWLTDQLCDNYFNPALVSERKQREAVQFFVELSEKLGKRVMLTSDNFQLELPGGFTTLPILPDEIPSKFRFFFDVDQCIFVVSCSKRKFEFIRPLVANWYRETG